MYAELTRKRCSVCKKVKSVDEFYRNGSTRKDGSKGPRGNCKICANKIHNAYVAENKDILNATRRKKYHKNTDGLKDKIRAASYRYRYGFTPEEYQKMSKKQKNKCGICKLDQDDHKRRFAVDHCHKTNTVRGLLCEKCNRGIGFFDDDISKMKFAIRYLSRVRSRG